MDLDNLLDDSRVHMTTETLHKYFMVAIQMHQFKGPETDIDHYSVTRSRYIVHVV